MSKKHPILFSMIKGDGQEKKVPDQFIRLTEDHGIFFEVCADLKSMDTSIVRVDPDGEMTIISKLPAMPFSLLSNYTYSFAMIERLITDLSEKAEKAAH